MCIIWLLCSICSCNLQGLGGSMMYVVVVWLMMVLVSIVVPCWARSMPGMRLWSVVLVCWVYVAARAGLLRSVLVIALFVSLVLLTWCGVGICAMMECVEVFFFLRYYY